MQYVNSGVIVASRYLLEGKKRPNLQAEANRLGHYGQTGDRNRQAELKQGLTVIDIIWWSIYFPHLIQVWPGTFLRIRSEEPMIGLVGGKNYALPYDFIIHSFHTSTSE